MSLQQALFTIAFYLAVLTATNLFISLSYVCVLLAC